MRTCWRAICPCYVTPRRVHVRVRVLKGISRRRLARDRRVERGQEEEGAYA